MSNEERTLLLQRSQATDASTFYTSLIVGIGYCLSFSLLIAVYWLLKKEIHHRQRAEEVLSQTNEQLESRVQERTLELTQSSASLKDEIFERRQAEEKIRQQAALLDIVTDAIFVCDLEHRILF